MIRDQIILFKDFLNLVKGKTVLIFQLFISTAIVHVANLLPPIATSGIIAMITQNNMQAVFIYAALFLFFYGIYYAARYWKYYSYTKMAEYCHIGVQKQLFEKVANNEAIFEKLSKGKIIDTCSDDIRYIVDIINSIVEFFTIILKLAIIMCIFFYYNIWVASFVLILDLLYLKIMGKNAKEVARYYEGTRKYDDKLIDILNQMLMNLKTVKTLNMMPNLNTKLDRTRNKWTSEYEKQRYHTTNRYCTIPFMIYVGKITLYIFLAYLVISGKMTLDKLVLLISYFEITVTCSDEMLEHVLNLNNYKIRLKRINTILEYTPHKEPSFGEVDNDYIRGLVEFKNVRYLIKGKPILNNISFKIYPNEITAIVGHSGSGKTTILNLLYRFRKVKYGDILIDGENIYEYSTSVYTSNVSGVSQKSFIFDMSIKDNLSLVDTDTENQIEACKRVGLHDYIVNLPKGYNTIVGEEDPILSTGQRQLLGLARALLSKSEILLLDEITGNIDPATTTQISNVLMDLKTDHTIILVTHKPEMMTIADRVIVMKDGKVSAKGLNEKVYGKSSLYKELRSRCFASVSNPDED